ncbi:MAG: hypothetical protein ACFFAS_12595 [Promethearchaeota archaeon]
MISDFAEYDMGLTNWEAIELGLYFLAIGYYILLFFYFMVLKFRVSKKMYWVYFAGVSLFLALGRVCFLFHYFFVPPFGSTPEVGELLMIWYRFATFFSWMGISSAMGVLGILLLPTPIDKDREIKEESEIKQKLKVFFNNDTRRLVVRGILIIVPIIIGIFALILPNELFIDPDLIVKYGMSVDPILIGNYPVGRFLYNVIFLPLLVFLIPFMFIILARRTFGVLRKSYALNGLGFMIYFAGRLCQFLFESLGWPHMKATIPPLLIIASLLILAIANNVEQLK